MGILPQERENIAHRTNQLLVACTVSSTERGLMNLPANIAAKSGEFVQRQPIL
ncbi:MAG: hypothetical protein JNL98_12195 [Bryobacterales bacterium]|nr:hypothetical protein [Bryobacterales bacterium]